VHDLCRISWLNLCLVVVHHRDTQTVEEGARTLQIAPLALDDLRRAVAQ
jgi:hypothetical protein